MKKNLKRLTVKKNAKPKKTLVTKKTAKIKKTTAVKIVTKSPKAVKNKKSPVAKKVVKRKIQNAKPETIMRRKADKELLISFDLAALNLASDNENGHYRRKTDLEKCKNLSDSELVVVVQKENREAYRELFGRYQRKLFVYMYHLVGNREEVEDLLQNVFAKTYKNIAHFDIERKFSSWIYRIAHNEAVNFLKRKSKKQFISWEDIVTTKDKLETQSDDKLPEEIWMLKELTDEVNGALEKLPEKYKQVLLMRYFSEYSYDAIAQMLGKPVNTIGTLINRAKRKMMDEMASVEELKKGK